MIRILRCTWHKSFKQFMIYRATSWLTFLLAMIFYVIEYVTGYVYFTNDVSVKGWDRTDYLLLVTAVAIIVSLYNFIFILGHEELGNMIVSGELDRLLVRPLDPYWSLVLNGFDIPSLLELLFTTAVFIFLLHSYTITFLRLCLLLWALFLGVSTIFLLNRICLCLLFWLTQASALGGIIEDLTSMLSRPRVFFPQSVQLLFTFVVPLFAVTNVPVEIIKMTSGIKQLVYYSLCCGILYLLSRYEWTQGMKKYYSAN